MIKVMTDESIPVSKAFTAIGIMQLVQEGKIGLDDPINKYMSGVPATWQTITIRQFMTHTSGIPELKGKSDPDFMQTVSRVGQLPMSFQPGARQQYNNFNFAVMGKLIESVSGMEYLRYMQQRVFQPAGMVSIGIDPSGDNTSTGHLEIKKQMTIPFIFQQSGNAGKVYSNFTIKRSDFKIGKPGDVDDQINIEIYVPVSKK